MNLDLLSGVPNSAELCVLPRHRFLGRHHRSGHRRRFGRCLRQKG